MNEKFSIAFPASPKHLRPLREWCRIFLARTLPEKPLEGLVLAVSEACANTIEHCFGNDSCRDVRIDFEVGRAQVKASIRNYCLAAVAHRIRPGKLAEVRPRGLGLRFIEETVDRVQYVEEGDGFLALVLTQKKERVKRGH